ncbi:TraE/TraK family type IV conjugative transfer system protein [uncultured Sphingorhabdus sp.]|uniref:TraE/TraK family type IV conjugative transfer system protein n=1 Tax=uncultured Sphingorhabdus sp. TaxID=1686106 RepID=UPI00262E1580|nr:TraE/TraK family type IV conjugative transfer system protein [uncultured Sphingorhabdus sp.]
MELAHTHAQSQRYLKQRNLLGLLSLLLLGATVLLSTAAANSEREIILQPILSRPLALTTDNVPKEYLELVTRDTAMLTLNRSPENLQFWMDQVLDIADPRTHDKLKADLMRVFEEQRRSTVSQYPSMERMGVHPATLTSEVNGVLHTIVGQKEVSAEAKTFKYIWTYNGVSLKLAGFGLAKKDDKTGKEEQ